MMCVLQRMVLIGAIAVASAPVPALTDPAPTADKRQMAKQYVDTGLAAQNAGDYDSAITLYQMAYHLVPHPVLLFNIAQAHRLAGRLAEALAAYKRYVAADPSGSEAQTARDFVVELEARLARPADAGDAPPPGAHDGSARNPAGGAAPDPSRDSAAAPTTEPSHGRALRIAGVVTGSAGLAALLVGAGYGLHARSLERELSATGAVYDSRKEDDGERANQIAITGFVAGGALVAAGTALYFWGHQRASERPVVAPVVSAHGAGLAITGSWR